MSTASDIQIEHVSSNITMGLLRGCRRGFVFVAMVLFALASAHSQQITAAVVGTVTDPLGAVISNAHVVIENTGTSERRAAQAESGNYTFDLLQIGDYVIHVDAPGFKTVDIPSFTLVAGERRRVDVKMALGQSTETVQVSASEKPALDTDNSTVGETISQENVENLPMNGLNFVTLAQVLVAGSTTPVPGTVASGTRPDYRSQDASLSVNGQFVQENDFLIDGMDNNERVIGVIGVRPSVDAMAEFRVDTNLYTADVGRTAGAVVNIITKAGANTFHGSAYEYLRNNILDARSFFALTNPELRQNQFGGSLGGPILKDKAFFFADYQDFRIINGSVPTILQVPTLYEEQHPGDLSDIGGPVNPAPNQIALNYFALYPVPNYPGPAGVGLFDSSPSGTFFQQTGDLRVDYHFTPSDSAFVRYTINKTDSLIPSPMPEVKGVLPGGNLGAYAGPATDAQQNLQINYVRTFTQDLIANLRVGYLHINNSAYGLNYGHNDSSAFGIVNANLSPLTSGLTPFIVGNYATLGDSPDLPLQDIDNTYQVNGDVIYNRGSHSFHAGAAAVRRLFTNAQSPVPLGGFIFEGGTNVGTLALMFQGIPYEVLRGNQVYPSQYRVWEPSTFLQDDWHATKRLTLGLGVRYDVFTPYVERHNHMANFDLATSQLLLAGVNGVSRSAGVQTDYGDIAPRIGFSYTPFSNTVISGGFGITHYPGFGISFSDPPFTFTYSPGLFTVPLSQALPIPTVQDVSNLSTLSGTLGGNMPLNSKIPAVYQTSLGIEHSFGDNVLQVRYVGDFGRHGQQDIQNSDTPAPASTPYASSQQLQMARPYYNTVPNITQIYTYQYQGVAAYNALQVTGTRHMKHGLAANLNYTWAHALDDTTFVGDGTYSLVPSKIRTYDYGNSDNDIRHRIAGGVTYDLPFGQSSHGFQHVVTYGWQIDALGSWQTGYPFEATDSASAINTGVAADRPNMTGNPWANVPSGLFFNPGAFATQALGTVGNEARNALHGPHQRDLDASASKEFALTEKTRLRFRCEVFNLTNTPSFGNPDSNIEDQTVGLILSAGVAREMQGSLKLTF